MKYWVIGFACVCTLLFYIGCATQEEQVITAEHPKFETLCAECHTLDRVHRAHDVLSKDYMRMIVEEMQKKPDSGIDLDDIDDIVEEIY